jgi:hypothetical protein
MNHASLTTLNSVRPEIGIDPVSPGSVGNHPVNPAPIDSPVPEGRNMTGRDLEHLNLSPIILTRTLRSLA